MLSDQELQSLRNWGNLAEEAADEICALRAALAAQPAEPVAVMWLYPDGRRYTMTWVGQDEDRMQEMIAERGLIRRELYAAPAAVPPDGMDTVAIKYAHKMALDLECILAEYGGSWYNTAMQTLGEYRSEMNAIHERECPTFMGEPVIAAAGDKP